MKLAALARRLSFLVKGGSLSKGGRVGLNHRAKLGSFEIDLINTREVRFDEVYACEVTSIQARLPTCIERFDKLS